MKKDLEPISHIAVRSFAHCPEPDFVDTPGKSGIHFCFNSVANDISPWIVDTGASNHMVCDISLFTSVPKPSNVKVRLPNNVIITATFIGDI